MTGRLCGVITQSSREARASARKLAEQHLIKLESGRWERATWHPGEGGQQVLSLLDLHLQYLRHRGRNSLRGWHAGLLQRCGRRILGWDEEREDDSYWGELRRRKLRNCSNAESCPANVDVPRQRGWLPRLT